MSWKCYLTICFTSTHFDIGNGIRTILQQHYIVTKLYLGIGYIVRVRARLRILFRVRAWLRVLFRVRVWVLVKV